MADADDPPKADDPPTPPKSLYDFATNISNALCCPIHHELLDDPVLLPCGHAACRVCVHTMCIITRKRRCALCNEPVRFTSTQIDELPIVFALKHAAEALTEHVNSRTDKHTCAKVVRLHNNDETALCASMERVCLAESPKSSQ
eukprot:TRINITY_DN324_c0_g1_i1.p1 TRINITY_DN324_c0_g1~~TRINITY_DN324_c0_g1_i1.p1  ORF type:complete len:157 (-),score=3.40 TRINITY_DN324_c0_g1_i1:34-465(-)